MILNKEEANAVLNWLHEAHKVDIDAVNDFTVEEMPVYLRYKTPAEVKKFWAGIRRKIVLQRKAKK